MQPLLRDFAELRVYVDPDVMPSELLSGYCSSTGANKRVQDHVPRLREEANKPRRKGNRKGSAVVLVAALRGDMQNVGRVGKLTAQPVGNVFAEPAVYV